MGVIHQPGQKGGLGQGSLHFKKPLFHPHEKWRPSECGTQTKNYGKDDQSDAAATDILDFSAIQATNN
jgi:hypothetical protein